MVLFILLEITSPVRVLREGRVTCADSFEGGNDASCSAINLFFLLVFSPLRKNCFKPGNVAPQQAQSAWLLELATLLLQTQVQAFLAQVASFGQQLIRAQLCDLLHFHDS